MTLSCICILETSALWFKPYLGKQERAEKVREGTEPGLGSYSLKKRENQNAV